MLLGTTLSAQNAFLEGSVAVDVHRVAEPVGPHVLDTQAPSLRATGGVRFGRRWVAAGEVELGRDATVVRSTTVQIGGRTVSLETRHHSRLRGAAALGGIELPLFGRCDVRALAGVVFTRARRRIESDATAVVVPTPGAPSRVEYNDSFQSVLVGADALVAMSSSFAVVAGMRWQRLHLESGLDGYSVRPSVGAQWTF
jgi:hypothetical protein